MKIVSYKNFKTYYEASLKLTARKECILISVEKRPHMNSEEQNYKSIILFVTLK